MNIQEIIKAVQTAVGATADGSAGPDTWRRIYNSITGKKWESESLSRVFPSGVDPRSAKAIETLLPEVRPYAEALVTGCAAQGIRIIVTSGTRSYAEQDALYAQGRSKPGRVVTNARAGFSNHNFGLAFDVTIFNGGKPVWESPLYKVVGSIGRNLGLDWGGDWKTIVDEPHFTLKPKWSAGMKESVMLAKLRSLSDLGKSPFA